LTNPSTDFWQKTHYGFERDNGHCLFTKLDKDFIFFSQLEFNFKGLFDQCGVMVRINQNNWIKASIEYEDEKISKLGSVVTNLGYSDWAMTTISSNIKTMWYKVKRNEKDFQIENSLDGEHWSLMRITHLHMDFKTIEIGIYACSPEESSFKCMIKKIFLD